LLTYASLVFRDLKIFLSPFCLFLCSAAHRDLHSSPTRRSSDPRSGREVVAVRADVDLAQTLLRLAQDQHAAGVATGEPQKRLCRSEEHTSELQSHLNLVCRLLLEKKKNKKK